MYSMSTSAVSATREKNRIAIDRVRITTRQQRHVGPAGQRRADGIGYGDGFRAMRLRQSQRFDRIRRTARMGEGDGHSAVGQVPGTICCR